MNHLTPETWRALRARTLDPRLAAPLLKHLAEDCADCDGLAESIDDPLLDAAVDSALGASSRAASDELSLRRIEARVLETVRPRRGPSGRWVFVVPIGVAAAIAAVGLLGRLPGITSDATQHLKGEQVLSAAVARVRGAPLEPVQPGGHYPASAELYFTWQQPQDAHVYLARVGGGVDGAVEAFYPRGASTLHRAGVHSLTVEGTVHAYLLEGLKGPQRFVLLTSPRALSDDALDAALKQAAVEPGALVIEVDE